MITMVGVGVMMMTMVGGGLFDAGVIVLKYDNLDCSNRGLTRTDT